MGPDGEPVEGPDCKANPKLCMPPRYCDMNPMAAECIDGPDSEREC